MTLGEAAIYLAQESYRDGLMKKVSRMYKQIEDLPDIIINIPLPESLGSIEEQIAELEKQADDLLEMHYAARRRILELKLTKVKK